MLKTFLATAATVAFGTAAAMAQSGTTSPSSPGAASGSAGAKMTSAQCETLWNQMDSTKAGSVTQAQAQKNLSDFRTADANSDSKLSRTEFMNACDRGLVSGGTGSTGAGSGASGATGMGSSGSGSATGSSPKSK